MARGTRRSVQLGPCVAAGLPVNQDGEVQRFDRLQIAEALAASPAMTVDAALVTLDFALRHGLLPHAEHLAAAAAPLFVAPDLGDQTA